MIIADAGWLHTLGQISGVILLLEFGLVLVLLCGLMVLLAVSAWWVRRHVVPVAQEYGPRARDAMAFAETGSDRVVNGIAEFYGRRQAVQTGIRVLLFGKRSASSAEADELVHAAAELQMTSPVESSADGHIAQGNGRVHANPQPEPDDSRE